MKSTTSRFSLLLLSIVSYSVLNVVGSNDCSSETMAQCVVSLKVLTDNEDLGFASTREELTQLCPRLSSGLRCVEAFTRRCMDENQRNYFNLLYKGTKEIVHKLCQDSRYQEEYLRHAPCMGEVKNDYEKCAEGYHEKIREVKDLGSETVPDEANEKIKKTLCCSFQLYLNCSQEVVRERCGEDTAVFTKGFVDKMTSSLFQTQCQDYVTHSDVCDSLNRNTAASLFPSLGLALCFLVGLLLR